MNKAVFLDRDGTINKEVGYLYKIEDFKFIPGAPEGIKLLNQNRYKVIVITNQAGVARGFYQESDVQTLHNYINEQLKSIQARIDAFYYCPHHPTAGLGEYKVDCGCRKPKPGLIIKAAQEFNIDLKTSFMIGDKIDDVIAGQRAGCNSILVQTGYGGSQNLPSLYDNFKIFIDLYDAIKNGVLFRGS